MKKIIIASVLGIAVILSGCGGGGDDASAFVPQDFILSVEKYPTSMIRVSPVLLWKACIQVRVTC